MYCFHAELNKEGKLVINCNLNKSQINGFFVFSKENTNGEHEDNIFSIAKHYHCICVSENENEVIIINDLFATFPVFIYTNNSEFIVESIFENFKGKKLTIDKTGCYELLMYESGLYDRTIFKEIKDLPAASRAIYNKKTKEIKIESYWDYKIDCDDKITGAEAVEKVWSVLSKTYKEYKDNSVLMGMSGGLDSRLSLCLLKKESECKDIKTFTFGHSENIKDYKYACAICKQLGMDSPRFFKLSGDAYREGMLLPVKTGGCLGVAHSHAWYCLNQTDLEGKIFVSNYYSDGVMGYDCRPTDVDRWEDCDYYRILNSNKWNVPPDVLDEIKYDLNKMVSRRKGDKDNYSGYNEYIYITERNPKFHMRLSYVYSELMPVELPFATYDLLEAVISLPQSLRYYKKIEHLILSEKLGEYADVSSTRYAGLDREERTFSAKFRYNAEFIHMLVLNRINAGLKMLSNGAVQISNPYITENHLAVFDRYFIEEKIQANKALNEWIGFNISDNPLVNRNFRTADAERGFSLLNLYLVLREYMNYP